MKRRRGGTPKEWWRRFFTPITGEVLFVPKTPKTTAAEVAEVIRQSKARAPLAVLDLGCGTGRHALAFAARGFEVTGLDYSQAFLHTAREAARKAGASIRFVRGDMKDLRRHFAANAFDLVVSLFNSFGYFDSRRDDAKMVRAVHRVLRPGGAFVLNTLNAGGAA